MLWTRADLSFALVNNLELLTHYAKRAENERCFSRQNRDEKKTEMRKIYRYGTTLLATAAPLASVVIDNRIGSAELEVSIPSSSS